MAARVDADGGPYGAKPKSSTYGPVKAHTPWGVMSAKQVDDTLAQQKSQKAADAAQDAAVAKERSKKEY